MKDIKVIVETTGKFSNATMREMFDNSLAGSRLLKPSDWTGFVTQKKGPSNGSIETLTDTDR